MTKEEKQLLLKDLCTRLPYGVKLRYVEDLVVKKESHIITLNNIYLEHILNGDADIKPYLRPMSSMSEEEQRTLDSMCNGVEMVSRLSGLKMFDKAFDWLYSKHLDIHGLIEKGLALEAPEDMYKNE